MREEITLTIEGIEINRLLNRISTAGIPLKKVRQIGENKISVVCYRKDLQKIDKFTRNRFLVVPIGEKGPRTTLKKLSGRKITILGVFLFAAILFYQSLFIARVDINGIETLRESDVRAVLMDNGIAEGARRGDYDLEAVEFDLFDRVDGIAWMELHERGGVVTVDIVESISVEQTEEREPGNIIARKEGFVEKVIALNGISSVETGQHVYPGDILISGTIPNKTDETDFRYVAAEGKVYARCIYVLKRTEPAFIEEPVLTGGFLPGVSLVFGDFQWDSSESLNRFDQFAVNRKNLLNLRLPLPVKVTALGINETENHRRKRTVSEIKHHAEVEMLKELQKSLSEESRIEKKDLQFKEEENIIEVTGIFEVMEEIGGEGPIVYERTED